MADVDKNVIKTINSSLLQVEISAALPMTGISWRGFIRSETNQRWMEPFPEASRRVGRSNGVEDFANRGDLRLRFDRDLTGPEDTQLDGILTAHDHTQLTQRQQRQEQDNTDTDILKTRLSEWDTLNNNQRWNVVRRMLRMIIRLQRRDEDV